MLIKFKIDGMSCGHCVLAVEKELNKMDIHSMRVEIGSVKVEYDPEKLTEENIINAIEDAGYKVVTSDPPKKDN